MRPRFRVIDGQRFLRAFFIRFGFAGHVNEIHQLLLVRRHLNLGFVLHFIRQHFRHLSGIQAYVCDLLLFVALDEIDFLAVRRPGQIRLHRGVGAKLLHGTVPCIDQEQSAIFIRKGRCGKVRRQGSPSEIPVIGKEFKLSVIAQFEQLCRFCIVLANNDTASCVEPWGRELAAQASRAANLACTREHFAS
ncbi:hypothetical protein D3C81_893660 [compost metagenome]